MTIRNYQETVECPRCHAMVVSEQPFCGWIRNHPLLGVECAGIVRLDLDVLLHKYMDVSDHKGDRSIQAMMFVEVKTFEADLTDAQRDSLWMMDQIMRNRVRNIHQPLRRKQVGLVRKLRSMMKGGDVTVFLLGGHVLRLQYDTPERGWLEWDRKRISIDTLIGLLRFDIDPDTLRRLDIRRRSGAFARQLQLFDAADR